MLKQKEEAVYLPFTVAAYEGGGYSESKENRKRDKEEHRLITKKYLTGTQLFFCRAYLVVTLVPLRRYLAENKKFAAAYEKIKAGIRK